MQACLTCLCQMLLHCMLAMETAQLPDLQAAGCTCLPIAGQSSGAYLQSASDMGCGR